MSVRLLFALFFQISLILDGLEQYDALFKLIKVRWSRILLTNILCQGSHIRYHISYRHDKKCFSNSDCLIYEGWIVKIIFKEKYHCSDKYFSQLHFSEAMTNQNQWYLWLIPCFLKGNVDIFSCRCYVSIETLASVSSCIHLQHLLVY